MNDFDKLAGKYGKTNLKPDKKYSMLSTVISLLNLTGKEIVIDVGCGEGFFSVPISKHALKVIGIDRSNEQLRRATPGKNVEYHCADMFDFHYPKSHRICCPFVLNYLHTPVEMIDLFRLFYASLNEGGKLVTIVDTPNSLVHNNIEYGSIKRAKGSSLTEGVELLLELYDQGNHIVTLTSVYHTKNTLESCLSEAGFKKIDWKPPIVSDEGIEKMGDEYWERYKKNCDISYLLAEK